MLARLRVRASPAATLLMTKYYAFGDFILDTATRELRQGGERQLLAPRLFECLCWLIEHRQRAVGRDELLAAVWGQVDADANVLVQVIARLRRLVDAPGAASAIRTVPRFGYRWVLPTAEHLQPADLDVDSAADSTAPAATPILPPPRRISATRSLRWLALLPVLLLAGLAPAPPFHATQTVAAMPAAALPETAAPAPAAKPPAPGSPEQRYQQAWRDFVAGRLTEAGNALQALQAEVSAADAPVLRARVLNGLANVQYQQGDYAGQRRSAEAALALLQGEDAPAELGRALMGRAVALVKQGQDDAAQRDLQLARVALETAGDPAGMARAELALGVLQKRRGRYAEARNAFQGALDNLAAVPDTHDALLACTHLLETQLQLLEPAAALALEPRLAGLITRTPPSAARSLAEITRIELLQANGRLDTARALLGSQCAGRACATHPWRLQLAALRLADPAAAGSREELQQALRDAPDQSGGRDAGRAWLWLLRDSLAQGEPAAAERVLAGMQAWADADASPEAPAYAALARAEAAAARGNAVAARSAFSRALDQAEGNRVPADLLAVADAYVAWLLRQHDNAEAGVVAGRVAAWSRADFSAALVQLRVQQALGRRTAWLAALRQAQQLAGQRPIPPDLARLDAPAQAAAGGF